MATPIRIAAPLAIVLAMLTPHAIALVPLFSGAGETCGMSCCRRMKTCCCRQAKPHAADRQLPGWQATPRCGEGCRPRAVLPPAAPALAITARLAFGSTAAQVLPLPARRPSPAAPPDEHALRGRPPPFWS